MSDIIELDITWIMLKENFFVYKSPFTGRDIPNCTFLEKKEKKKLFGRNFIYYEENVFKIRRTAFLCKRTFGIPWSYLSEVCQSRLIEFLKFFLNFPSFHETGSLSCRFELKAWKIKAELRTIVIFDVALLSMTAEIKQILPTIIVEVLK